MDRREFLKLLVASTAGLFASKEVGRFRKGLDAFASLEPDLVVAKGSIPSRVVEEAIEAFGGIKRFISRNDRVLIKPNIAWDRAPNLAANTNPEIVGTLVRLCVDAGAREVRVFDRTCNDPRRSYVSSGIAKAARDAGANVFYADEDKVQMRPINGNVLKSWPILTAALEVDKIINVPIAKVHSLSQLTLGMKNWFGIAGGSRSRFHQHIHNVIPEIASVVKPTLVVLDAIRIMESNGPTGGSVSYVKKLDTVIVGRDQVAVDAYGTTLFGLRPQDLGFVVNGYKMGLGQMHLDKLNIKKISV